MFNLYKANMARLFKKSFYIFGLVVALAATYVFTSSTVEISFLAGAEPVDRMVFVSAAMVAFFTIFVPIFTNSEYTDGVIRNKMISGLSQKEIYVSHLLTEISAAVIMWVCYMVGGILGGAKLDGNHIIADLVILVALFNYIATVLVVSFRLKKLVPVIIFAAIIFNCTFNSVMMGNLALMLTNGTTQKVMSWLYNVSALGQWFTYTGFAAEEAYPGVAAQLLISSVIIVLMTLVGTFRLNKRDLG